MAIGKVLSSTTLSIEVENGVNSSGDVIYKKRSFSGINPNAMPEDIFQVAEGIKGILSKATGDYYLSELSKIETI